jgi:hypothetical protein
MSKPTNFVRTVLLHPINNHVDFKMDDLNEPLIINADMWHVSGLYRAMFRGLYLNNEIKELVPLVEGNIGVMWMPSGHINSIWISERLSNNNTYTILTCSLEKPKDNIESYQLFNVGHCWTLKDPRENTIVYFVKLKVDDRHYTLQAAIAEGADILFYDEYSETDSQDTCNLLNKNKYPGDEIYIPVYRALDNIEDFT